MANLEERVATLERVLAAFLLGSGGVAAPTDCRNISRNARRAIDPSYGRGAR